MIETSGHLPECPWADRGYAFPCICDRLRACEQRVHDHYSNLAPVGFLLGVQAARDAVADARTWPTALTPTNAPIGIHAVVIKDDALAAIDGLKEEEK